MSNKKQMMSESQELASALRLVLSEIDENGFPNLFTLRKAYTLWSAWGDNRSLSEEVSKEYDLTDKIRVIKYPESAPVGDVNLPAIISALKKNNGSMELLLSLKRQQLIAQETVKDKANTIMKLIRQGFIEEYVLDINGTIYRYYTLSSKALLIFDEHNASKKIKSHFPSLSVPVWLKNNSYADQNLLLQAAIINNFFSKKNIQQYLTFAFSSNPGLILANEISDELAHTYYCALGLDATKDSNNVTFIKKILDESTVNKLVIICLDNVIKSQITNVMKTKSIAANAISVCSLEDIDE